LTNVCLVAAGFFMYGLQRLLYGPLRQIETEQLYEKAWFAVTETCLAMTIFRGEFGGWFLVMFVCLVIGKVWGWIGDGRVEILEQQPPQNPRLFHARLATSLILSVLFDFFMLDYSIRTVLDQARPDMMVMFGFEFAVLTIISTSTLARYGISLVEIYIVQQQKKVKMAERQADLQAARDQAIQTHQQSGATGLPENLPDINDVDEMELDVPGWEEKGRWVFYLDLITDFCKLVVYLAFFAILFTFYGLPIHILRDVLVTIRSFVRRIMDFMRYRNATRDMHERYPDATADEIAREDVCIICREEMIPWQQPDAGGANNPQRATVSDRLRPKKLPCGHILHFSCLRSWLERQQNCPTCRRPVIGAANQNAQNGVNDNGRVNGAAGQLPGPHQHGGANVAQGVGQVRPRVFQFGPFRIGFGAGRGDFLQNLQQQLNPGNPIPNPAAPGAQQIGLGFGFGRADVPPPAPAPAPAAPPTSSGQANLSTIQDQMHQIEQQITQQINALRSTVDRFNTIRVLQAELQHLRNQPTHSPETSATGGNPGNGATTSTTRNNSSNSPSLPPQTTTASYRHSTYTLQGTPIPGGDSRLPEGVTLPPGWTLTPLNRLTNTLIAAIPNQHFTTTVPHHFASPLAHTGNSLNATFNTTFSQPPSNPLSPLNGTSQARPNGLSGLNNTQTSQSMPATQPTPTLNMESVSSETTVPAASSITPGQECTDNSTDTPHQTKYHPYSMTGTVSSADRIDQLPGEPSGSSASSSSKGKAKVATVEDTTDDQS
jgi:E3 ubiquitin-protein ligase synoviolin